MENRIHIRPMGFSSANENAMLPLKNMTMEQTPRKLPFKDSTNNELTKSVLKQGKLGSEKSQAKQEQASSSKLKHSEVESATASLDDYDYTPFVFPADKNCYCCGDDRKTDGEVWGKKLALTEEFWEKIMSVDVRLPERFVEQFSPIKLPSFVMPPELVEEPLLDSRLTELSDESIPTRALSFSEDLDSSLEVPDFDLDFSLAEDETNNDDDSIIQHW